MKQPSQELPDCLIEGKGGKVNLVLEFVFLESKVEVESDELVENGGLRRLLVAY